MSEHDRLAELLMSLDASAGDPSDPAVRAPYDDRARKLLASEWMTRHDARRAAAALEPVRELVEGGRYSNDMVRVAIGLGITEHWADCARYVSGAGDCSCPPHEREARVREVLPITPPVRPAYRPSQASRA